MKVCFLITGILRQFHSKLYPFLESLDDKIDYDIVIHTTKNDKDSKYLNFHSDETVSAIVKNKKIKLAFFDDLVLPDSTQHLSQREKNTFLQWYRLQEVISKVSVFSYDWILRIRPDVEFHCSPERFLKTLEGLDRHSLHIPQGNDIFDTKYLKPSHIQPINDQIFFLPSSLSFVVYDIYNYLFQFLQDQPIVSEYAFATYLHEKNIDVRRIDIPYSLILSPSRILAISGDSASGKSTLVSAIQKVFPFDSNLLLETDRYHKWERHNPIWNTLTHLHPDANNLEKLLNDTYQLKIGNDVYIVDYDHEYGRFTNSKLVESKPIILLCGLHTFYDDRLRNTSDLKIFVDTEEQLKTFWKVHRDMKKRNYTKDEILEKIKKREKDYHIHILPQKEYADIILYYTSKSILHDVSEDITESNFSLDIEIKSNIAQYCYDSLYPFCSSVQSNENKNGLVFHILPNIPKQKILDAFLKENLCVEKTIIENGYLGVLQLLILRVFYTTFHESKRNT